MYRNFFGSTSEKKSVTYNGSFLVGVNAQAKLLLKILQDHTEATKRNRNDGGTKLRVATMLTILENIRSRIIQGCQVRPKNTETIASTSNSNNSNSKEEDEEELSEEEQKERLRQALNESMDIRKVLDLQCSDLVKQKRNITGELFRRTYSITETEAHINSLKDRHKKLKRKVMKCVTEHKDKVGFDLVAIEKPREKQKLSDLQSENREIRRNLVKKMQKRQLMNMKTDEIQQQNRRIREEMEEITSEVKAGMEKFEAFKERMESRTDPPHSNVLHEMKRLESLFSHLQDLVSE